MARTIPEIASSDPVVYPPRVVCQMLPSVRISLFDYFAALRRHVELHHEYPGQVFVVVADYQALHKFSKQQSVRAAAFELATIYLALGLEWQKAVICRESDVPEIMELAWIVSQLNAPEDDTTGASRNGEKQGAQSIGRHQPLFVTNILAVRGTLVSTVPDGDQDLSYVRTIASNLNRHFGQSIFPVPDFDRYTVSPLADVDTATANKLLKEIGVFHSFGVIRQKVREHLPAIDALSVADQLYKYEYRDAYERWKNRPGDVEEILRHGGIRARQEVAITLDEVRALAGI